MKPYTPEILDSIIWSLQTYVKPELQSPFANSVLMTVENLLRHIKIREELEIPLLVEDNRELEEVLEKLHSKLTAHKELSGVLTNELETIHVTLQEVPATQESVPSAVELNRRSEKFREVLDDLLKALSAVRKKYSSDETYRVSRQEIRDYIAHSLQREAQLITPAFTGGRR
jgi:hypothetical protein